MTEEVTPQEAQKMLFLDLDEHQFGTVAYMSSAGAQMSTYIGSEQLRNEMIKLCESGNFKTVGDGLAWVRGNRNHILNLASGAAFALSLLGQVEDLLVDNLLKAGEQPEVTE